MEPQELRSRLSGVITFPVTPFNADLSLNLKGLQNNLERLLEQPISAVIAPGGTGEMYSLTAEEHVHVVRTTVEVVRGRVPVLTGVGVNQRVAVDLAAEVSKIGVDGILAFPPYYPHADDEGLRNYYQSIGRASQLGMIIYSRDWVNPGPAMVERLAAIPNLIAWKDGQGDMRRCQLIMNHVGDRLRWIGGAGDDLAPSYYGLGIRAFTSSIANFAPGVSLRIHDLASKNKSAGLNKLMADYVVPHYSLRARRKGYEVSVVKATMDLLGMCGGPVRPPLVNITSDEREELRKMVGAWRELL